MSSLYITTYGDDPLRRLAGHIVEKHHAALPNLTDIVILLPDSQAEVRFRQLLLDTAANHHHSALLGPTVDTLPRWISQQSPGKLPVLSEHQRELMLVEALVGHKYLYGEGNPWTLADSLLTLFDDLGATHLSLPDSLEPFLDTLGTAYGLDTHHDSLFGEARLVHTLWQAWQQEMQQNGVIDRHTDYTLKLASSRDTLPDNLVFYIAGLPRLSTAEAQWLAPLLQQGRAFLLLQSSGEQPGTDYHPDAVAQQLLQAINLPAGHLEAASPDTNSEYTRCLDSVFSNDASPLRVRARNLAHDIPQSPLSASLSIFEANNAEKEAQAIDVQVRLWWNAGNRNIGIVTENRRLARRVRALLERSGIELQDAAGWALSTTSAAATVERWLETVEEDFAHQPLLDFLKSPFLLPEHEREALLSCVYRFEQGVVLKENIARNMARYREHLQYRQNRLPAELTADYDDIHSLLDIIESAAAPLRALTGDKANNQKHAPVTFLHALNDSFTQLGLDVSLAADAAGQRILEELHAMQTASDNSKLDMHWDEFRAWLGRTLERFNFQPPAQSGQVQLMSLAQSSLAQFDALIIAGAEAEYLPGSHAGSPFFNDGVRQSLGLASHTQQLSEKFYDFRCLLESADTILLTRRIEQDGEEIVASPWLERLQSFHQIAWADRLINTPLTERVNQADMQVTHPADPMPRPIPAHPAAHITAKLFPAHMSASAYQQLINCPYQFFAARCLQLEAPDSIREMLAKADYGERVHLSLQAFHEDVRDLPGPFNTTITSNNQAAAIQCLNEIATAVFARDLEDNFLHRGWLRRWQEMIPAYIEWQRQRQQQWRVKSTEQNVTREHGQVMLRGRLDRIDAGTDIDSGAPVIGIVDYKTGTIPKNADVLNGESVQLPFYALLVEHAGNETVTRVEYLALDTATKKGATPAVKAMGTLETETLDTLVQNTAARLDLLVDQITEGTPMPAWGDDVTCKYCQMSGICRREAWQNPGENTRPGTSEGGTSR
ncbi:MAG: DNA helicase [Gammaproteobacteria bacterium]|nr:DNA helicase [Gammaproteobacteria bacterium]